MLREVTVKIALKKIDTQEGVTMKVLLDSKVMGLVISSEFAKKQKFKLKKIERLIYVRNVNDSFNKKEPIKHIVKVNIYYQGHRKRMKINVISRQKWSIILRMPWLACHNPKINQRTGEVKMTKCLEECRKYGKLKQEKQEQ